MVRVRTLPSMTWELFEGKKNILSYAELRPRPKDGNDIPFSYQVFYIHMTKIQKINRLTVW